MGVSAPNRSYTRYVSMFGQGAPLATGASRGDRTASIAVIVIAFAVSAFFLFFNLDYPNIQDWDETRHAVNAFEMVERGDYLVQTYEGAVDYFNLKPPLSMWATALGFKVFGLNSFGMRFFSPVFVLLAAAILVAVSWKLHGAEAAGASAMVFLGLRQIYLSHFGRTADPDAPFIFFASVSLASMLLAEQKPVWAVLGGLGCSLAFLTKSWHALSILAVWGLWLLLTGKWLKLGWKTWIGVAASIVVPIGAWATARYARDGTTFLEAMVRYDLLNRTASVIESHGGSELFYFVSFFRFTFPWLAADAIAIALMASARGAIGVIDGKARIRKWRPSPRFIALFLWMAVPFTLFTIARTKLGWYIYICFPAFAVISGTLISRAFSGLREAPKRRLALIASVAAAFTITMAYVGYRLITAKAYPEQAVLADLGEKGDRRGERVYLDYLDGRGSPSSRFAARLYAGLLPTKGGLAGFLNDADPSVLLVADRAAIEALDPPLQYEILAESGHLILVKKRP